MSYDDMTQEFYFDDNSHEFECGGNDSSDYYGPDNSDELTFDLDGVADSDPELYAKLERNLSTFAPKKSNSDQLQATLTACDELYDGRVTVVRDGLCGWLTIWCHACEAGFFHCRTKDVKAGKAKCKCSSKLNEPWSDHEAELRGYVIPGRRDRLWIESRDRRAEDREARRVERRMKNPRKPLPKWTDNGWDLVSRETVTEFIQCANCNTFFPASLNSKGGCTCGGVA